MSTHFILIGFRVFYAVENMFTLRCSADAQVPNSPKSSTLNPTLLRLGDAMEMARLPDPPAHGHVYTLTIPQMGIYDNLIGVLLIKRGSYYLGVYIRGPLLLYLDHPPKMKGIRRV